VERLTDDTHCRCGDIYLEDWMLMPPAAADIVDCMLKALWHVGNSIDPEIEAGLKEVIPAKLVDRLDIAAIEAAENLEV